MVIRLGVTIQRVFDIDLRDKFCDFIPKRTNNTDFGFCKPAFLKKKKFQCNPDAWAFTLVQKKISRCSFCAILPFLTVGIEQINVAKDEGKNDLMNNSFLISDTITICMKWSLDEIPI